MKKTGNGLLQRKHERYFGKYNHAQTQGEDIISYSAFGGQRRGNKALSQVHCKTNINKEIATYSTCSEADKNMDNWKMFAKSHGYIAFPVDCIAYSAVEPSIQSNGFVLHILLVQIRITELMQESVQVIMSETRGDTTFLIFKEQWTQRMWISLMIALG